LRDFDADNVSEKVLKATYKITDKEDFRPEVIKKQSMAGEMLVRWVLAV